MHETPRAADERQCLHCRKETEDGLEVELTKNELRGPAKAAWLCEGCNEDRRDEWDNDEFISGAETICDLLEISNELEPYERFDRAKIAIEQLKKESEILRKLLQEMDKAGLLTQAILSENPYCCFLGPKEKSTQPMMERDLTKILRLAVQETRQNPLKWEIDQLTKRALNTRRNLVNLYQERENVQRYGWGGVNLWAIPHLEALRDRTEEQIEKLMSKMP